MQIFGVISVFIIILAIVFCGLIAMSPDEEEYIDTSV